MISKILSNQKMTFFISPKIENDSVDNEYNETKNLLLFFYNKLIFVTNNFFGSFKLKTNKIFQIDT